MKRFIGILILVLFVLSACHVTSQSHSGESIFSGGTGSLEQVTFTNKTIVPLNGEWKFHWKKFLSPTGESPDDASTYMASVPSNWKEITGQSYGYATYEATLTIPPQLIGNALSIYIPYEYTAYTLYIDGKFVASNGYVGKTANVTEPEFSPKVAYFHVNDPDMKIVMHVSNFSHPKGGFNRPILFGKSSAVEDYASMLLARSMFLIGGLLFMGIYFLSIQFFRRQEKTFLFFGLMSLFIAVRSLLIEPIYFTELVHNVPWIWQHRLEYVILFLGAILFVAFIRNLYPRDMNIYFAYAIYIFSAIAAIVTLFTAPILYVTLFNYFLILYAIAMLYLGYILVIATIRKRRTATLNLVASSIFFLTVINDTFVSLEWSRNIEFSTMGFFMYMVIQSINLSKNYARKYEESEELTAELTELANSLDEKITLRTAELEMMNAKLVELTLVDGLTGVNNRRFINQRLEELIVEEKLFSLLLIDLDHYKQFNDLYGHIKGDELLQQVASFFKEFIGNEGTVARYGGEEFLIILPETNREDGAALATKLCHQLENRQWEHKGNSASPFVTISIGGASSEQFHWITKEEALSSVDTALYTSKEKGRNTITFL
ncbi:diguanylate cyclase domain-containing protein [Paenisporosarcina cavernae]|uniref:Diguanylate cyclase n=1 Tax=Paenisporosarcina cavernae TaxID=2320858 RepID=A0A385YQD3_9BACL|nr:diguanylate cyclase [Paenisporosarcina cavernae]AYC28744.1 diguanylate cyclase [Paenisporosarcina cavernae]